MAGTSRPRKRARPGTRGFSRMIIGWWRRARRRWRGMSGRCWTHSLPSSRPSDSESRDPVTPVLVIWKDRGYWVPAFAGTTLALQRLDLRRGAVAQQAEIHADGDETEAALGHGQRPRRVAAINAGNLAGLACGGADRVDG